MQDLLLMFLDLLRKVTLEKNQRREKERQGKASRRANRADHGSDHGSRVSAWPEHLQSPREP